MTETVKIVDRDNHITGWFHHAPDFLQCQHRIMKPGNDTEGEKGVDAVGRDVAVVINQGVKEKKFKEAAEAASA